MDFFDELKRRNVFKVAGAYLVVGWLLVESSGTIGPLWGLPETIQNWTLNFITVLFPFFLLGAWMFKITPKGVHRFSKKGRSRSYAWTARDKFMTMVFGALVFTLGYVGWDNNSTLTDTSSGIIGTAHASIAVLPFADMSPEKDQLYFTDGISEEILNVLAQVPDLKVTSRSSAFRYRGNDIHIPTVANTLGVAHILEGSVRKFGNRIRITAQLIEAQTDSHLWAQTYDRELDDIFAVQDEISAAIVEALSGELGFEFPLAPNIPQTENSEAYDEYLLGILEMNRRNGESLAAAKTHLEAAVALDPNFAPAHARLSLTMGLIHRYNNNFTWEQTRELNQFHAARAMDLAPNSYEALAASAFAKWENFGDLAVIRNQFERVVALNPSYTDVMNWLGNVYGQEGNEQASIAIYKNALRVDPFHGLTIRNNIDKLLERSLFEEARPLINRLRSISLDAYWYRFGEWQLYQGKLSDGAISMLKSLSLAPTSTLTRGHLSDVFNWQFDLPHDATRMWSFYGLTRIKNGQMADLLAASKGSAELSPLAAGNYAWALLQGHRYSEAVMQYDRWYDFQLTRSLPSGLRFPRLFQQFGIALKLSGDEQRSQEMFELALNLIMLMKADGINEATLLWDEAATRYALGQKKESLELFRQFLIPFPSIHIPAVEYRQFKDDPEYLQLIASSRVRADAERDKFLNIVCNGGNPAPEAWTPLPKTCTKYLNNE